jgi:LacI family transcriptional regulator, repressor for deo operon, udp, cdd, tsx, nupC, and nupG
MSLRRPASLPDVVAKELRNRLALGHWQDALPGLLRLSKEFGVSRETIELALEMLSSEGWLAPPEHGKKRTVRKRPLYMSEDEPKRTRVTWFPWRPIGTMDRSTRELITEVIRLSSAEGVELAVAPFGGTQLKNLKKELETLSVEQRADAWIFQGGNVEIASWFADYMARTAKPCLAVGGRVVDANLAQIGFDLPDQISVVVDYLVSLGHRRIVMPLPPQVVGGGPTKVERAFRERMAAHQLKVVGDYNLPVLDGTLPHWHEQLRGLFGFTPPTAFILTNGNEVAGLAGFLHRRGLRVPEDVSIVFEADEPVLQWMYPEPSRIQFSSEKMARFVWKWIRDALDGKPEATRQLVRGQFIPGSTTAPPSLPSSRG